MVTRIFTFLAVVLLGFQAVAQQLRKEPAQAEIDYFFAHPEEFINPEPLKITNTTLMPPDARFPGEYEESQAVAIGWPYSGSNPDTSTASALLWARLASAIQQECSVWLRLKKASDTGRIKTYMANRGTPLSGHRFFFYASNAYWMRDFGPLGFYYSSDDSIGFVDMHYYDARPFDDLFPAQLAGELGYKNVVSKFYAEGGNYMTDGWRNSFHSSKIIARNMNAYGWTAQQAADSVRYYWASDSVAVQQGLHCDGGTQHIDMYMKLLDDETFAFMEYPPVVTAPDKALIDSAISLILQKTSAYNRPYRVFKVPMPTNNDGSTDTSCTAIDNDARTFVNGLLVNKTYIMPTYSSAVSGNKPGDTAAIRLFEKMLPGYNIVPIDARLLTVMGGALHCVTMQIPAENPLRIWHPSLVGIVSWAPAKHLIVRAENKSGIASVTANWRKKGSSAWNTVPLADSSGYHVGDISGGYTAADTIEYYITATSNNAKSMTKPLTAPAGYFTFYFSHNVHTAPVASERNFVLNPVPNPGPGRFYIPLATDHSAVVTTSVFNVMGVTIRAADHGLLREGLHKLEFDLTAQPSGIYFIRVTLGGQLLAVKRVVKL